MAEIFYFLKFIHYIITNLRILVTNMQFVMEPSFLPLLLIYFKEFGRKKIEIVLCYLVITLKMCMLF